MKVTKSNNTLKREVVLSCSTLEEIIAENNRRRSLLKSVYDPVLGVGAYGIRKECRVQSKSYFLPVKMLEEHEITHRTTLKKMESIRIRYDFEFWCIRCVVIKDKTSSRHIPFRLNRPQRRVVAILEGMRERKVPIRMIMLKARQWGGSTLVQIYMAWIQIVHHTHWNSVICGHLKDASAAIKGMYSRLLREYPEQFLESGKAMRFKTFEKSNNVSEIAGRECLVVSASSGSQEAMRGYDISMAHLTEVSFWRSTNQKSPESLISAVCGSVALEPDTVIVLESTANGVGNYFHTEWLRSKAHLSDKEAVFVPWYEIEIYRMRVNDVNALLDAMDDYEVNLWKKGLTLEMIAWHHAKRKEYTTHAQMMTEYPTDDIEAFSNTTNCVFNPEGVEKLRYDCYPATWVGELDADGREGVNAIQNIRFEPSPQGKFKIWKMPDPVSHPAPDRYYVVVDVGGMSESSDYSVIAVLDRFSAEGRPEIVAQWRGHTYHDILAWKAVQIAKWYCNALLIIESNTLEAEHTEGDGSSFILDLIASVYRNLYRRKPSPSDPERSRRYGFHTNRRTKDDAIYWQIKMVRDGRYIEHDEDALEEYSCYERKSNGSYGAKSGHHDDILMTRSIALYVSIKRSKSDKSRSTCHGGLSMQNTTFFGLTISESKL